MTDERTNCAVCGAISEGFYGPTDDQLRSVPCCDACGCSGKAEEWWNSAVKRLRESPVAFESRGNVAEDLKELERFEKHNSRMEDGVCPNGCARMVRHEPGNDFARRCPTCGFVGFSNVPIEFPYE